MDNRALIIGGPHHGKVVRHCGASWLKMPSPRDAVTGAMLGQLSDTQSSFTVTTYRILRLPIGPSVARRVVRVAVHPDISDVTAEHYTGDLLMTAWAEFTGGRSEHIHA